MVRRETMYAMITERALMQVIQARLFAMAAGHTGRDSGIAVTALAYRSGYKIA